MHRFRKKSDASTKRGQVGVGGAGLGFELLDTSPLRPAPVVNDSLPELPPASNFRTSLILPELTRRFTLLRTSSGQPLSIVQLKNRFAEQRARGAQNQISEEEEDMILETLGKIHNSESENGNGSATNGDAHHGREETDGDESSNSKESAVTGSDYHGPYERSPSNTTASSFSPSGSSVRSSPSSRSAKRYSNNLFGSGRMRDYNYNRSQRSGSQRSVLSVTPAESSLVVQGNSRYSDRPITPDGEASVASSSIPSSPMNDKTPVVRSAPLNPPSPYVDHSPSAAEYRISRALNPAALKRASLALEEALKEIEEEIGEEAEDEIVMPRSAPASRRRYSQQSQFSGDSAEGPADVQQRSGSYEAGTAISPEKHNADADVQRASPVPSYGGHTGTVSPSPRLPGYIPGMPRPMTPRDPLFDSDDQSRPHSTTPRPISPHLPGLNGHSSPLTPTSIVAGLMRRDSNASTTYSPMSLNGTFLFDDQRRSADLTMEDALSSPIPNRRRPASPLAGPAYQPMAVSSRPGTPSNVTWNTPSSLFNSNVAKTHGRNESGDSGRSGGSSNMDENPVAVVDRSNSIAGRSLHPPDLHLIDRGQLTTASSFSWDSEPSMNRTPAVIPNIELDAPAAPANRSAHSPTPTQSRSPPPSVANDLSSNAASRRTSRQNAPSPFNFGPAHSLNFSPRANSSRSSVASAGSSYHSDDGSHKKDFDLFSDVEAQYPPWHDVSSTAKTSAMIHDESQDESEAEDIISRYAGLTKLDFVAIQEKLVGAAVAKASTPDPRERVPSLRRRRPSTSQSNYSLNGRDNKATTQALQIQAQVQAQGQPQNPTSVTYLSMNADNATKTDVPQDPATTVQTPPTQSIKEEPATSGQRRDLSPSSRRNRDLAQALFGEDSNGIPPAPTQPAPIPPQKSLRAAYHQPSPSTPTLLERSPTHVRSATEEPAPVASPTSPYPVQMTRNPSILRSPQMSMNQTELAREVQRKTEAATASLKRGPSAKYHDANISSISLARKRITPHQISTPHLVSASTSMDTIPLRSPSVTSGNALPQKPAKLGQRIRRWGTLRSKPTMPTGEEITPFPLDAQPQSPLAQSARYVSPNVNIPQAPASASLAEYGKPKDPLPSPPATAGPGLKGFMSRFRKPRTTDMSPERDRRSIEQDRRSRPPISNPLSAASTSPLNEFVFPRQDLPNQSRSTPAGKPTFQSPASSDIIHPEPRTTAPLAEWGGPSKSADPPRQAGQSETNANDTLALKQLFDAASNLGLDQTALNDLLARSGSTSSRSTAGWTMLTRNNSSATGSRPTTQNESTMGRARSPILSEGSSTMDGFLERNEDTVISNVPRKREQPPRARIEGEDGEAEANAIVRRTIIFPSESRTSTIDLNILMRKNSSSVRRHRSASAGSITSSSRSVHDRAPTPPPPRSSAARRFSHDASPPVPQLPVSLSSQAESLFPLATPRPTAASPPMEKSSSAYDSLYEMYAGERATLAFSDGEISPTFSPDAQGRPELTRGVEVIEMANGETIWSIVNGLRDEDVESSYASRSSFTSDSSMQQQTDNVQVFFKEHSRMGSKGSNSSFLARKKLPAGNNRPETKVFYSSSNQIGRLIENLSEGQEAGSFNFVPTKAPGHSNPPSFHSEGSMHWTVEERLEHMLGSIGNP